MPRRVMRGTVVGDKADKTIMVRVDRRVMHPLYKKVVRRSKRYAAHDDGNKHKVGDIVQIRECAPSPSVSVGSCSTMPAPSSAERYGRQRKGRVP